MSPNDYQLVTAAATALRMLDRKHEAEKWYRQVSKGSEVDLAGKDCRGSRFMRGSLEILWNPSRFVRTFTTFLAKLRNS